METETISDELPASPPVEFHEEPTVPKEITAETLKDQRPKNSSSIYIWGTKILLDDIVKSIQQFIDQCREKSRETNEERLLFERLLLEAHEQEENAVNLDCEILREFDPKLFRNLVDYPSEILQVFDQLVNAVYQHAVQPVRSDVRLVTRPFNLKPTKSMRHLDPERK